MIAGRFAITLLCIYAFTFSLRADDGRVKLSLNEDWLFYKGDATVGQANISWSQVTVPHTWNKEDPFDDESGYYRGIGCYKRIINVSKEDLKERKIFLHFEAINQEADIFLNGKLVGNHQGGYTAFTFEITKGCKEGANELFIRVTNEHNLSIPPLKGDFNFYGGIYRDVYLIKTSPTHFNLSDHGSTGVNFHYLLKNDGSCTLSINTKIISNQSYEVVFALMDKDGNEILKKSERGNSVQLVNATLNLNHLNLWYPDDPYLYKLKASLISRNTTLDEIVLPVGFRTIRFDSNYGCFINNKPYKLHGVNRHQDVMGYGSAVSTQMHVRDVELIKSIGANFLRTAHYPQDQAVLDACDRLGIVVSMEIPIDHDMTNSSEFKSVTVEMMREMIRQYKHHPSIAIWAYMNEMFLGKKLTTDKIYIDQVVAFAKELNQIVKEEDPSRYSMIANHGDMDVYTKSGLTSIPDIVGWNLYHGWYDSDCNNFGNFVDQFHKQFNDKPIIITEFGAGSDPRIHSFKPVRFDFSVEWQNEYFECIYKQLKERTFIAGSAVWNMFDFGAEARADAIPHINKKGLCTYDRKPKDAFYIVKAQLSQTPFVRILSSDWDHRTLYSKNKSTVVVPIEVVGIGEEVELTLNGVSLGKKKLEPHSATWNVNFTEGKNRIMVVCDQTLEDQIEMDIQTITDNLHEDFETLYINMGADFYFQDTTTLKQWISNKEYTVNSWGTVGGISYRPRDRGVGTDKSILKTDLDPIYQTSIIGLQSFKAHIPNSEYEITMSFTEPEKNAGERIFDITINGKVIKSDFDIAKDIGKLTATDIKAMVVVENENLVIELKSKKGETILNAIQIQKR